NLDGKVDVGDLGALASYYGVTANAVWSQGDFGNNGDVSVGDLGALATNYGLSLAAGSDAQPAAASAAVAAPVPEPSSAIGMIIAFLSASTSGRRRKRLSCAGLFAQHAS